MQRVLLFIEGLGIEISLKLIAEIIVVAIVIAIGFLWHKLLGMLNSIFPNIQVHGNWQTIITKESTDKDHEGARLWQFAHWVWGVTHTTDRKYRLSGQIRGQALCLIYRQIHGPGFDHGAIMLTVNPNGKVMDGYELGYDLDKNIVSQFRYRWKR